MDVVLFLCHGWDPMKCSLMETTRRSLPIFFRVASAHLLMQGFFHLLRTPSGSPLHHPSGPSRWSPVARSRSGSVPAQWPGFRRRSDRARGVRRVPEVGRRVSKITKGDERHPAQMDGNASPTSMPSGPEHVLRRPH